MVAATEKGLRELRQLLGYSFDSVARFAHIPRERLAALEAGEPIAIVESDRLASLYGVEADRLLETPILLNPGDAIGVLASQEEFRDVSDQVRVRIVAAANAARDLVRLRRQENPSEDARARFQRQAPPPYRPDPVLPPHRQGAEAAQYVRKHLQLGREPIRSVRELVQERFSSIHLLYAHLGAEGPAGITFADALRGPTIVLNLDGKNVNPCVRRFSLLHELCHLLVDWTRQETLGVLSGYLSENRLETEQRANAFAVRFLCPESELQRLAERVGPDPIEAARELRRYGLHYAALRLYLANEAGLPSLPQVPPSELVGSGTEHVWYEAELPQGLDGFPLRETPPERRTLVASAAARAYSTGRIRRDAFAEALGLTPAEDVEQVLDYFALPLPDEDDQAAA
jgi:Zn-dependent peptidase ImmA (M78 family)